MKFGSFDDANREYVITTPKTPLPWINYLGSKEFFTLISNTCGGYTFYKDAKLLRLTRYRYNDVPFDINGKYFYIKDGETVWNPGWQPIASHQLNITLQPGESKSFVFVLGYIENPEEEKWESYGVINKKPAEAMIARYATDADVEKAFAELNTYWDGLLSKFTV